MNELAGRVALITGGASGIGEATAYQLAEEGAHIVIGDLNEEGAERVAKTIEQQGGHASSVGMDVSQATDNNNLVETALHAFGRVDMGVANAGLAQAATPIEAVSQDIISRLLFVNIAGVIGLAQVLAPVFKDQKAGVFVATASTAGVRPRPGIQVYSSTKGAVIALIRALALEWAPFGIRACAISPVATDTPMLPQFHGPASAAQDDIASIHQSFRQTIPLGTLATPKDIAEGILFLVSDRARLITGTVLEVDGGRNI